MRRYFNLSKFATSTNNDNIDSDIPDIDREPWTPSGVRARYRDINSALSTIRERIDQFDFNVDFSSKTIKQEIDFIYEKAAALEIDISLYYYKTYRDSVTIAMNHALESPTNEAFTKNMRFKSHSTTNYIIKKWNSINRLPEENKIKMPTDV